MILSLHSRVKSAVERRRLRVVLASGSPRRREALGVLLGSDQAFDVAASSFPETLPHSSFAGAREYCLATARGKAADVVARVAEAEAAAAAAASGANVKRVVVVVAADTVVALEGRILEKPADAAHAKRMLRELSGKTHEVHTSVVVAEVPPRKPGDTETFSFVETTKVTFAQLKDEEIEAYVATGEPLDKAGAYGIQAMGRCLVERVEGDFFNVVGFPGRSFAVRFGERLRELLEELE